jgi:hypothetical protein
LHSGLQIKENPVKYRNWFLEKSCNNIKNIKERNKGITEKWE